jgi:hypothetical protein
MLRIAMSTPAKKLRAAKPAHKVGLRKAHGAPETPAALRARKRALNAQILRDHAATFAALAK